MKRLIAVLFLLVASVGLAAQIGEVKLGGQQSELEEGIFQRIENASVAAAGEAFTATPKDRRAPVEMTFMRCQGLGVDREQDQWWILPISATDAVGGRIDVNHGLWILPVDAKSKDHAWYLGLHDGKVSATKTESGLRVLVDAGSFTLSKAEARPHSDPFGHRFSLTIAGGAELEDALAGFYWGTMLPLVVEKTMAAKFPYSSGYVLSTLKVSAYAGSYPAVDHEFQIKGRLAMGSEADLDVVRRMIELQFKLMNDDPEHLYRAPTSVQPDGSREYHVHRNSKDNRQNAAMFPLTGNIEVMEEAWHYYEARKDVAWLRANIDNLEHAAGWTLASVDQYGRVWSDVYYEDQVIKDGRVTQAQAFAAYAFELMAGMERVLGRHDKVATYAGVSKKLAKALIEPLPMGYWDEKNQRFVDWVDRDGKVHDHIHLVANALPVTYGYATAAQADAVKRLIDANDGQFERFPSFLAADIAGYDKSEIGSGGPYDLSAAGRYWYWDAAYREGRKQNAMLLDQLKTVAAEGAKDGYYMGERYDMDYVYYIDGKNAHGAEKYYEYPCVYAAVLISKLLGLTIPADADVSVAPHLSSYGSLEFGVPEYALRYEYGESGFVLKNLSDKRRRFEVDLSGLSDLGPGSAQAGATHYRLKGKPGSDAASERFTVELATQEEARWVPER
jgi:hypothetical protein